jgi:hypothetical protein
MSLRSKLEGKSVFIMWGMFILMLCIVGGLVLYLNFSLR